MGYIEFDAAEMNNLRWKKIMSKQLKMAKTFEIHCWNEEQKEIKIKDISIKKQKSGRFIVDIYADTCDNLDGTSCDIKKIGKILNKRYYTYSE